MPHKKGFLSEPIGRVLLRMSLSNSFGALAAASFALVDTYFVSLLGTKQLTAINFTHPITLLITSLAIGFGTSLSTLLARYMGANDIARAKPFLLHSMMGSLLFLGSISFFCFTFHETLFQILGAQQDSLASITDYMYPWYLAVPLLTLVILFQQALRSLGEARTSATVTCYAAILNLILDPILILGVPGYSGFGIQGATYASLASWLFCLGWLSYLLYNKYQMLQPKALRDFSYITFAEDWQRLCYVARPASLTLLLNPLTQSIILALIARSDPYAIAAYGTGLKIQSFCIIGVTAVSASLMPFLAQNLGANQKNRAFEGLIQATKWVFIWHIALCIPLHLFSMDIALWFTQDPKIANWLQYYLNWMTLGYAPLAIIILITNAFIAYQKPIKSMTINFIRSFVLMVPLTWAGLHFLGVKGAFLAPLWSNILMGIVCYKMLFQLAPQQKNKAL